MLALGLWIYYLCVLPFMTDRWGWDSPAGRLHEWLCIPALIAWFILTVFTRYDWWDWPFVPLGLWLWWWWHKNKHQHKKRKRLLEAGRGYVRRMFNRLVVVPEAA